jgi:hypothetical protein
MIIYFNRSQAKVYVKDIHQYVSGIYDVQGNPIGASLRARFASTNSFV